MYEIGAYFVYIIYRQWLELHAGSLENKKPETQQPTAELLVPTVYPMNVHVLAC